MFYTYVLQSKKSKDEFYIGYTTDLSNRLKEHNQGLNLSTKRYKPWKVIYCEICTDIDDTKRRERYLKTTQGGRLLKRRLKEYFYKQNRKI
jgi:putative endonuclease